MVKCYDEWCEKCGCPLDICCKKEGAIIELKVIIKRNSNFRYSRLDMIEFCEKRLERLQGELK
jgi:hypothetical protein